MATTVKPIGGAYLAPKMVVADVAFDASGDATVTAKSLGLEVIKGFVASPWGGTADHVASIHATTSYATAGVTSIVLEAKETVATDAGAPDALNVTVPILFWGD